MEKRREAKQLQTGDVVQLQLNVNAEATATPEVSEDGKFVQAQVKPVPCGPDCGSECDCQFESLVSVDLPLIVRLKSTQRVPFVGNLETLRALRAEADARIKQLEAGQMRDSDSDLVPDLFTGAE